MVSQPNKVTIDGKRYVVIPEAEYNRLRRDATPPGLPTPNKKGRYPARATLETMIAQDLTRQRKAAGLTQQELADRAGVRVETISRIESGKHTPSVRTIEKLQRAMG